MNLPEGWSHFYEISSDSLADWVERRGSEQWWVVDGDSYINSRLTSPCPSAALTRILRRAKTSLFVQSREAEALGQIVGPEKLDELAEYVVARISSIPPDDSAPNWAEDRCLWLCWMGRLEEWMLAEDAQATEAFRSVKSSRAGGA